MQARRIVRWLGISVASLAAATALLFLWIGYWEMQWALGESYGDGSEVYGNVAELGEAAAAAIQNARTHPTAVVALLDHPTVKVRLAALHALARERASLSAEQQTRLAVATRTNLPALRAELRPLGRDKGARVAVTLALLGDRESIPALIAALRDQDDYFFVGGACEALGRLGANESASALRDVAEHHWSPHTRMIARQALATLEGKYRFREPVNFPAIQIPDWDWEGPRPQPHPPVELLPSAFDRFRKAFGRTLTRQLAPRVKQLLVTGNDGVERLRPWCEQPNLRRRLAGGTLLGYDRGEWSYGLVFVPSKGPPRLLLRDNITHLFPAPAGIWAVGVDYWNYESRLYLVSAKPDGSVVCTYTKRLPGIIETARLERDGAVLLEDYLRLRIDGRLERIPR